MLDSAKKKVGEKFVGQLSSYLSKNPEKNIANVSKLLSRLAITAEHKRQIAAVNELLLDPGSNWRELYLNTISTLDPHVRDRLAVDFFVNSALRGLPQQRELENKLGHGIPWAILIDPTDRCNLRCQGCWAGEYTRKNDLEYELLDRIIAEGEQLHIHFYVLSGGEPLVRKDDIIKLAAKHNDSVFHVFTNGTLIDAEFARQCSRTGNIIFALSIDGFEDSTDARRGQGVFQKVMNAADILHREGMFYGFSSTYHRHNIKEIFSDQYIDVLIAKGFRFGWYFTYIPVGADSNLDFMATPEQRAYAYQRIQAIRNSKPVFGLIFGMTEPPLTAVLPEDGVIFISMPREIEPCAFIHYANGNIHNMSVQEALKTPLFLSYQKRYPFNTTTCALVL
jgi:MoaA/NifB/PqqE/SkfB family radical SAM enzyme